MKPPRRIPAEIPVQDIRMHSAEWVLAGYHVSKDAPYLEWPMHIAVGDSACPEWYIGYVRFVTPSGWMYMTLQAVGFSRVDDYWVPHEVP